LLRNSIFLSIVLLLISGCSTRFDPFSSKDSDTPPKKSEPTGKGTMRAYKINGIWYYPKKERLDSKIRGMASWYGEKYHGRKTANGEVYNMYSMTAAHKTLPMNTMLLVKNLETGKEVQVRVNDRGPFIGDRILDLSKKAAEKLGMLKNGTSLIEIRILGYDGKIEVGLDSEESYLSITERETPIEDSRVVIKPIIHDREPKSSVTKKDDKKNHTVVLEPIEIGTVENSDTSSLDIEVIDSSPVNIEDIAKPVQIHSIEPTEKESLSISDTHQIVETETEDNIPTFILEQKSSETTDEVAVPTVDDVKQEINKLSIAKEMRDSDNRFYYVQVASFRDESGAKLYMDRYSVVLDKPKHFTVVSAKGLFKVWVAGFSSKEEAKEFVADKDKFPSSFLIIKEESVE